MSGRRTRRPETHRHAVEDRLADDRLDDRVVDPVVDGLPIVVAGYLLPRRAVRMAPAVRQTDHPGTHLVGDRDTHLATMDAALEYRHLAVTDLMAGGVVGMNVEHAALATRHQRRQVVHPGVVAAQLTTADQDQAVLDGLRVEIVRE